MHEGRSSSRFDGVIHYRNPSHNFHIAPARQVSLPQWLAAF